MMKYSAFSIIKRDTFDDLIDLKVMNQQVVFEFCLFHLKWNVSQKQCMILNFYIMEENTLRSNCFVSRTLANILSVILHTKHLIK